MNRPDVFEMARLMIRRYGLQAQAVAQARAAEQGQGSDTAAYELWQRVHTAICEVRRVAGPKTGAALSR
jgi:hypothetical protein